MIELPLGEILVTLLYQAWRPELLDLEKAAAADKTTAGERMRTWLHMVRHCILAWIVSTAARPRDRFGCILVSCDTKGEIVSSDISSHMDAIYDTAEYTEMAGYLREYERQEIARGDLVQRGGSERRTREDIAALGRRMEDHEVRITTAAATEASTAITTAASSAANAVLAAGAANRQSGMCDACRKPPFLANAHAACREPADAPALWSADCCVCRTAFSSCNSRCREMADALRCSNGDNFMRLWAEWASEESTSPTTHIACVDQRGTMWVHLAAQHGLVDIVEFLLRHEVSLVEAMDTVGGKLVAYAMEPPVIGGAVAMVAKLLEFGADTSSPCTPSALAGFGWTPEQLAHRKLHGSERDEVLVLLRSANAPPPLFLRPPDPRLGLTPRSDSAGSSGWASVAQNAVIPPPRALPSSSATPLALLASPSPPNPAAASTSAAPASSPATLAISTPPTVSAVATAFSETEAALRARVADLEAKLAAAKPPLVPQPLPPAIKEITGGVPHVLRIWRTIIQPQERIDTSWRSAEKLGVKEAHALEQSLSAYYQPILRAVMKRHLDDSMALDAAAADLETLRAGKDLSKFAPSLPKPDADAKRRYKAALLELPTPQPTAPLLPSPESTPAAPVSTALPTATAPAVPSISGATRYLAFDPSLSCGWAILEVMGGQVVSVAVGAMQVDGPDIGSRCNDLQRQLQPLFMPPPASVFVESFYTKGQATDAISISLRAVIAMEAKSRDIALVEVAPQSWKSAIGVSGAERDKAVIKSKLESTFGAHFPAKLPNASSGRPINFKDDASDAAGIALWGAQQRHEVLSFVAPMTISAPSLRPQEGEARGVKRLGNGKAKASE